MTSNQHRLSANRRRRYRRRHRERMHARGIHRQSRPAVPQCVPSDATAQALRAYMAERAENEQMRAALHRQAVDIHALESRLRTMTQALSDARSELAAWSLMPMKAGAA